MSKLEYSRRGQDGKNNSLNSLSISFRDELLILGFYSKMVMSNFIVHIRIFPLVWNINTSFVCMYTYTYTNTDTYICICIYIVICMYIYTPICHFGRTTFGFLQWFEEVVINLEFWNLDLDPQKISSAML